MKFEELLRSRRSVRNFMEKPVTLETIKEIIIECTLAPSAGNEQPWKFVIVNNKEVLNKVFRESKKNILSRIASNPDDYAKKYEKMLSNESFNIFYNAPAAVFILGKATLKNVYVDCALAASYFMLGAANRGLGSCWINFATEIRNENLLAELGIPKDCKIVAPIILGYPANIPPVPRRKEPEILKSIT